MSVIGLKNKIDYRKGIKVIVILAIAFFILNIFYSQTVFASGTLDYGNGENPFNKITDSFGQFVNDQYRLNYALDMGDGADWAEKVINYIPSFIFKGVVILAWVGINVFNFCFDSNISGKFSDTLETVSRSLHNGTFNEFYLIFFMISLIAVVVYFLKRNYAAIFTHIIGVTLIIAMSVILTTKGTRDFVVKTNGFSKEIGMTLISSLSGEDNMEIAKSNMIGTLWGNFVHKPWIIVEFDGKVSVDDSNKEEAIEKSKKILSLADGSDERKEVAKEEIGNVSLTNRVASSIILGLITIVKISILIIIGVVQMFLQVLSNIMIVFSPVILLLAIVPYFGGFSILKWLAEKYIAIQITIVLLSFVIGSLILIDKVMLEFFLDLGASFTVALLIQCVCWVLVIVFRNQIVLSFNKLQRKVNGTVAAGSTIDKVSSKFNRDNIKRSTKDEDIKDSGENIKEESNKNTDVNSVEEKVINIKDKLNKEKNSDKVESKVKNQEEKTIPKEDIKVKSREEKTIPKENVKVKSREEKNIPREDPKVRNKEAKTIPKENIKVKNREENNIPTEEIKAKSIKENDINTRSTVKEESSVKTEFNNNDKSAPKEKVESKLNNNEKTIPKVENKNVNSKENITREVPKVELKEINQEKIKSNDNKDLKEKEVEKVISFNEARVNKGKEKVNDEELKNNLRKDLPREYREGLREKQKIKESTRTEKLKNALGVSKKQIRTKERSLAKDLKNIKKKK